MTPEEIRRRMLDAIAGPESAGRYDVRYTPKGGATFQGYDQHPGIFEHGPAGPSSAAGRYQFTKTTWNRMGGGAFTPEMQDQRAWELAQQDYKRNTGQDLVGTIQRNGTLTPDVLKALSPTWAGFKDNPSKALASWNGEANIQNRQFGGSGAPAPTAPPVDDYSRYGGMDSPREKMGATPTAPAAVTPPMQDLPPPPEGLLGKPGMTAMTQGIGLLTKADDAHKAQGLKETQALWQDAMRNGREPIRPRNPFMGWNTGLLG